MSHYLVSLNVLDSSPRTLAIPEEEIRPFLDCIRRLSGHEVDSDFIANVGDSAEISAIENTTVFLVENCDDCDLQEGETISHISFLDFFEINFLFDCDEIDFDEIMDELDNGE